MTLSPSVNLLKKITLDIWQESPDKQEHASLTPHRVTFIFGIGAHGLSAMETVLADKHVGDEVAISMDSIQFQDMFGHLACMFGKLVEAGSPGCTLNVKVIEIEQPSDREIVKAMAGGTSCGGGCDCGCGC